MVDQFSGVDGTWDMRTNHRIKSRQEVGVGWAESNCGAAKKTSASAGMLFRLAAAVAQPPLAY